MSAVHAATTLALWAAARLGGCSADQVLGAVDEPGKRGVRAVSPEVAATTGLPGPGSPTGGSMSLLPLMQRGGPPALLLPHAGDLRGLPPAGQITVPALDCGAVVVFPALEVAALPVDGHWRVYPCTAVPPGADFPEAHRMLDACIADATRHLADLDVARDSARVRDRVGALMLAEAVRCPPGTPGRASALLAKAISMQALLEVAQTHETAAVSSQEMAAVDDALRPLSRAVLEARRAAVAEAVRVLTQQQARSTAR